MRFAHRLPAFVLAALCLSACATRAPFPQPQVPTPPAPIVQPERFADLPGWELEDHAQAFTVFRATCGAARDPALAEVCARARAVASLDGLHARAFFEDNFRAERIIGEGVLTAYFAPEYPAHRYPDPEFSAPVRGPPLDLVFATADRTTIETSAPAQVLAWMRPEELFFLQVQGSGVLTFADGTRMKAVYAANNGLPFMGIANPMRDSGLLAQGDTSGDAIRAWLAAHRGPEADAVMRLNPRYVFFRLAPDDGAPPVGAAGIPLPPGRAIAVDASRHGLGELIYIDAAAPLLNGAYPTYRRLVMALDVGGAIKGDVRADLYIGQGPVAGAEAGRVRHALRMHRLVPRVP